MLCPYKRRAGLVSPAYSLKSEADGKRETAQHLN